MRKLTDRQRTILEWIVAFTRDHDVPPTVREIGREFGISPAGVFGHLKALERKGYLERGKMGPRSIKVTRLADDGNGKPGRIPVLGRIAAGPPLLAVENIEGELDVGDLFSTRNTFAVSVKGDSMIEAGIFDGDYAVVHQQETADDGDIVVALIEDEATLKRLHHDGGRIRLEPANSQMKPIYADDVVIQGVVTGVVRRL